MQPTAFTDTFAVVRSALRLLWRHWPVLLALALAGFLARQGFLALAVWASELHAVVGLLVFALVPLSMLIALMLMMRVVRASLPDPDPTSDEARPSVFRHFASVLVPFLAVYAAYDYFHEDRITYVYEILMDESFANADAINNPDAVDIDSRLPFQLNTIMLAIAGAAFLLRWSLGRLAKSRSHPALGFGRGYLEATWLTLGTVIVTGLGEQVFGWVEQRRMVAWVIEVKDALVAQLGPLGPAADRVLIWLGDMLSSVEAVIVVPIAWLTIGCVVYGHHLVSPANADPVAVEKARRRWERLPPAAQTLLTPMRNDTRDRFGPMVRGLRVLRHAGLPTMLLFCLAFVVAESVPLWLWEFERLLIGPRDLGQVWMPLSGPLSTFNYAVQAVLLICLVTAAVDYVLRADTEPREVGELGSSDDPHSGGLGVARHDEVDSRAVVG